MAYHLSRLHVKGMDIGLRQQWLLVIRSNYLLTKAVSNHWYKNVSISEKMNITYCILDICPIRLTLMLLTKCLYNKFLIVNNEIKDMDKVAKSDTAQLEQLAR